MKMKTKYALTFIVSSTLAGLALPVQAQQSSSTANAAGTAISQSSGSQSSGTFVKHAQISSEFEKQAAELGSQRAQNQQLKQFAQQILQEHSQDQQQLQSLAQRQGLPQNEPLPQHLTKQLSKLDQQTGQSFDRDLATCLLKANARSLKQTQNAVQQIQDPQVRQFAQTLQQQQQQHLQQAAQVAQAVGVSQNTVTRYEQQANKSMGGTGESQEQSSGSGSSQQSSASNYGGTGTQSTAGQR